MAILSFKALQDGTKGKRFDVLGVKGMYRKRKAKKRYGLSVGETMAQAHVGKLSVYVQRKRPLRKLYDFALRAAK